MNVEFHLEKMTMHADSRANVSRIISENQFLPGLIQLIQQSSVYRLKAIVALEFYARDHWEEVKNYSEEIIEISTKITSETEKRCISKLLEKISEFQYKESDFKLPQQSLEKMASVCFDWLLVNSKSATKAFAMKSLFYLGFKIGWIHAELRAYLEQNLAKESAGFKSRGTKILKNLR